jgi:hypothetical protein
MFRRLTSDRQRDTIPLAASLANRCELSAAHEILLRCRYKAAVAIGLAVTMFIVRD